MNIQFKFIYLCKNFKNKNMLYNSLQFMYQRPVRAYDFNQFLEI